MSVASSAPGWDPGVAQIGPCVCPCRSVRQVRLMLIRVGGVGYRHPMLARLVARVDDPLLPGSRGTDVVQEVGLVDVPGSCPSGVGPSLVGHVGGAGVCAGRGQSTRGHQLAGRCGVALLVFLLLRSARGAARIILKQRLRPVRAATPAAPLPREPIAPRSERSLPQPGPRTRGVVGVSRR